MSMSIFRNLPNEIVDEILKLYWQDIYSKNVINDQLNQCESNDGNFLNNLHKLKDESLIMKNAILKCDRNTIKESLNRSWEIKSKTSKKVSNTFIDSRILKVPSASQLAVYSGLSKLTPT